MGGKDQKVRGNVTVHRKGKEAKANTRKSADQQVQPELSITRGIHAPVVIELMNLRDR